MDYVKYLFAEAYIGASGHQLMMEEFRHKCIYSLCWTKNDPFALDKTLRRQLPHSTADHRKALTRNAVLYTQAHMRQYLAGS